MLAPLRAAKEDVCAVPGHRSQANGLNLTTNIFASITSCRLLVVSNVKGAPEEPPDTVQ